MLWVKAFHIVFMVTWFAGLFYLPRLFVYHAMAGDGPSLIEIHTLRLWGHFEGDAQAYRTDLDTVDERDPIPLYAAALAGLGELSDAQIASIAAEAAAEVDAAITFAKSSRSPTPGHALLHVFA